MTFDEWFDQEFAPGYAYSGTDPEQFREVMRSAWEAGHNAGDTQLAIYKTDVRHQTERLNEEMAARDRATTRADRLDDRHAELVGKLTEPTDEFISTLYMKVRTAMPTAIMTGANPEDAQYNWGRFAAAEALAHALRNGALADAIR